MILADSSVWIDFFRGVETHEVLTLERLLGAGSVVTGDLIMVEVLQGIDRDREFDRVSRLFHRLTIFDISGHDIATKAARNFRTLRTRGITVRKTIDTLIATRCIENGLPLLYSDRDFDPFVEHLGLVSAQADALRGP